MTLFKAAMVVADGAAAQLPVADVVAGRNGIEARLPVDAEFRNGFLATGAVTDNVDVEVTLVTVTYKSDSLL